MLSAIYSYEYGPGFSEWHSVYIPSLRVQISLTPGSFNLERFREDCQLSMSSQIVYYDIQVDENWVQQLRLLHREQQELKKRVEAVGAQLSSSVPSRMSAEDRLVWEQVRNKIVSQEQYYFRYGDRSRPFRADVETVQTLKSLMQKLRLNGFQMLKVAEGFYHKFAEADHKTLTPPAQMIMDHLIQFPEAKLDYCVDSDTEVIKVMCTADTDWYSKQRERFWCYVREGYAAVEAAHHLSAQDFMEFETLIRITDNFSNGTTTSEPTIS
jgi:hypothetical protein